MERIFHYLAAVFTRFLFLVHAVLMICWLVLVKGNGFYFVFLVLLVALIIETIYTVIVRKGHEHNGFCLSMFLYLLAVIPCDWITKRAVLKCVADTGVQDPNSVSCQKAAVSSNIGQALLSVFPSSGDQNDEGVIYILEQALVLILVIGRWLLPKGAISRDQLSQLLLVYVGVAADIMEFTEIIKEDEIRNADMLRNKHFVNAVILFWSASLFQFTLTISVTERSAQRIEKEKAQLEEELNKLKELEKARKRNQIAPALYTYQRSAAQHKIEDIQLNYIHTKRGLEIKPQTEPSVDDAEKGADDAAQRKGCRERAKQVFVSFGKKCQDYIDLVCLLVPMIMQDGPFLVIRLIAIAYYKVSHGTLYFLTVKNALVVMLQVYRIFVLYYKPPEDDADQLYDFGHSTRLNNVQTAIKGVQHTRLAIRLVTRLQKQARWHNAGRSYNNLEKKSETTSTSQGII